MGFIKNWIDKYQKKIKERNNMCNDYIIGIDASMSEIQEMFSDSKRFIEPEDGDIWKQKYELLFSEISYNNIQRLKRATSFQQLKHKQEEVISIINSLKKKINIHNSNVARLILPNAYCIVGEVEGRRLDNQQMMCIVKEMHNQLIIAGAGTGKTTTIVGKIKYLLQTNKYLPEDILVLSFTNASAAEMDERIRRETGCEIATSTFHKLGLNIIKEVNGVMPKITHLPLRNFVKEKIQINIKNEEYLRLLSSYLLYNRVVAKSEFDFSTEKEYEEYLKLNPPTTINGELVKSYGEMDIANFLEENGIEYTYEHPYNYDTRTSQYAQYYPDFYLKDYDIYIEYFGINREGKVPEYFMGKNGKSASECYQETIEWKRKLHASNGTIMIECYSYEKREGVLLEKLRDRLLEQAVVLSPKSAQELWKQVSTGDVTILDGLSDLFETVINLIKSNNYTISDVRNLIAVKDNRSTNYLIVSLIEPIYDAYCNYLKTHGEIDFNDMINEATQYVREGKYIHPYKYVIVDEYQDISQARFSLLYNMRLKKDFNLFCVGDDWQSIYRFAGSDIGFILYFERYWGTAEIDKIETTYRFTQRLIEISGNFIMKNPAQIRKTIKGKEDSIGFPLGEICGYTEKNAIEFTISQLQDLPNGSSVFFVGRYSFDVNLLKENTSFICQYNNVSGLVNIKLVGRDDLNMQFITAHKSKGLQADYVFIINNKKSRMGFPSKIQNASILELLLNNCDNYLYAEERRLFYVALTRAKKKVYIVTVNGQESEFVMELRMRYQDDMKRGQFVCPLCGGRLIKRIGSRGEFFGCSNYSKTRCTYTRNIRWS